MNAKATAPKVADKGIKTAIWDLMKDRNTYTASEIAGYLEVEGFLPTSVVAAVYALWASGWFDREGQKGPGGYRYKLKVSTKRPVDEKVYVAQPTRKPPTKKSGKVTVASKEELAAAAQGLNDEYLEGISKKVAPTKDVPIPKIGQKPEELLFEGLELMDATPSLADIYINIGGIKYSVAEAKRLYNQLKLLFSQ